MDEIERYDTVTLADGLSYPCDYLSAIPIGFCFVEILDTPLAEVAAAFSDAGKTARITYGPHTLTGYTHLVSIAPEAEGRCKVSLRKSFAEG